jgi:hypothetical protein
VAILGIKKEKCQDKRTVPSQFSAWVPNAPDSLFRASQHAWGFAAFRLAWRTGVLDVFALLLRHGCHRLVFQVNQHVYQFKG